MQPFFDQKKKISPTDHVVISETLPLPLVVIHGHFMNPPPSPSSDHVVYGCPQTEIELKLFWFRFRWFTNKNDMG